MSRLVITSGDHEVAVLEDVTVTYNVDSKVAQAVDEHDNVVATMGVTWHQGGQLRGTQLYGAGPLSWDTDAVRETSNDQEESDARP